MHLFQQQSWLQQQLPLISKVGLGHCFLEPTSLGPSMLKALSKHSGRIIFSLQPGMNTSLAHFCKINDQIRQTLVIEVPDSLVPQFFSIEDPLATWNSL